MKIALIPLIGSIALVVLIAIFGYLLYAAQPNPADLTLQQTTRLPKIDNQDLEGQLRALKKVEGLPIQVDPSQLGKEDPYF